MLYHKVNICSRVDLWFCNEGFRFTDSLKRPKWWHEWKGNHEFSGWKNAWPIYKNEGIEKKVIKYLSKLPDRFKTQRFYQEIVF